MITFNLKEINRDDEQDQAKMIIRVGLTDQLKKNGHGNKGDQQKEKDSEGKKDQQKKQDDKS